MSDARAWVAGFVDDSARCRAAIGARAPSYHRLLQTLAAILEQDTSESAQLAERFEQAWAQRTFQIFWDRPLLVIAALRVQALVLGASHPLWPALAAPEPDPDDVTRAALLEALANDALFELLRARFVQTNETLRAVAWLWPAHLIGCDDGARPLALVEAGTAAGLNLCADRLPPAWSDSSGATLRTACALVTPARIGIDAHPLDACNDDDANWLRACIWAGERRRIARLEAAIAAFRAAPAQLRRGDITEVPNALRALSAQREARGVVLAFQTIVRDYLAPDTRTTYEQEMRRWLEDTPQGSALWIELEVDHSDAKKPVPIVAHVRTANGVAEIVLGKTGGHPTVVVVDEAAVERFMRLFG
jgi:hypothetical protein